MMRNKMKKSVVCFLVAILFFSVLGGSVSTSASGMVFRLFPSNLSISFQSKQPITYTWNLNMTDLDSVCSVPFDDCSFHKYRKVEVSDGNLYVAKGFGTPSQFLCINRTTGEIAWEYSTESLWNTEQPFVCLSTGIILNFQNAICLLNKKTGEVKQKWELEVNARENYSAIYVNEDILLVQDNSVIPPAYICLGVSKLEKLWTYAQQENVSNRFIGVQNESLLLLELDSDSQNAVTTLQSISLSSGESTTVYEWENACHVDYCFTSSGIIIGMLNSNGEGFLYSVEKSKSGEFKTTTVADKLPLVSLEENLTLIPSLQVEDDYLGFRVFSQEESYYMAVSVSKLPEQAVDENNYCSIYEKLFVYKVNKAGEISWKKVFSSLEKCNGIVQDAFIQDDTLVFQFPYRTHFSLRYTYAFWIELETGDMRQCFYSYNFYIKSGLAVTTPVFLPGIILRNSCLNENYLTSVQGFICSTDATYENAAEEVQYTEVELEKLYHEPHAEDNYMIRFPPFSNQNQICFFQTIYCREDGSVDIELIRYDVVERKKLPVLSYTYQDCDFRFKGFTIISDSLVMGYVDSYSKQMMILFDIRTDEVLWEKDVLFVDLVGENILYRNSDIVEGYSEPKPDVEFKLFDTVSKEIVNSMPFSTPDVTYIGTNSNGTFLFQRDERYVSFILNSTLLYELVLSDRHKYMLHLVDQYLLYGTDDGTIGCVDLLQKKVLWEKYLGNETDYIFEQRTFYVDWKIVSAKGGQTVLCTKDQCILFDLQNGVFLQEYQYPEIETRELCHTDSDYPMFRTYSVDSITRCFQLNLDSIKTSELLVFPEIKYDSGREHNTGVCSFMIQGKQYYVHYCLYDEKFICICQHPSMEEPLNNPSFLELGNDISNYLYCSPYLLFQTSIGDKNSNFHLVAFDTVTGELTKIHKGYHERVYIQDEKLVFSQCGAYYTCTLGDFDSIEKTVYVPKQPVFSNDTMEPVTNYQEGVPEEYAPLDLYYINKITYGSFTKTDNEEMIFVTGDDCSVTIGVMGEQNGQFAPVLTGTFISDDINYRYGGDCEFYQSLLLDIDSDGLEELVVLTSKYVVIGDYNIESNKIDVYGLLFVESSGGRVEKEMICFEETLYIQYYLMDYPSIEHQVRQFWVEYNPTMEPSFMLTKCYQELTSEMYQNKAVHNLTLFQFLEKPVLLEKPYVTFIPTECEQYPKTTMPPMYEVDEDQLNDTEKDYCQRRNEYLQEFLSFLEQGNDPFVGMNVYTKHRYPTLEYKLSLTPKNDSEGLITNIRSFDILSSSGQTYILMRITDEIQYNHMVLFTPEWELVDYRMNELWDYNELAQIVISEKQTDYFWVQLFDEDDEPHSLSFGRVVNGKMIFFEKLAWAGIVIKNDKPYFSHTNTTRQGYRGIPYGYETTCGLKYMDPFSGTSVNGLFLEEIAGNLEALYSNYFQQQADYLSFGNSGNLQRFQYIEMPNERRKARCLTEISRTIMETEYLLRKHS